MFPNKGSIKINIHPHSKEKLEEALYILLWKKSKLLLDMKTIQKSM